MMILKEFSRIVCVSLFSYQGSLFVCLSDSFFTLSHSSVPVKYFFQVFSRYFDVCVSLSSDLFTLSHVRFLRIEPHSHLSMLMCKEFSRIVCVSLFSYQGCLSYDSFAILTCCLLFVKNFF